MKLNIEISETGVVTGNVIKEPAALPASSSGQLLGRVYFTANDLKAAVAAARPTYDVRCDSEHIEGSGESMPRIWYTSAPTGTVVCANPEHPYFLGNVSATAKPAAPTTVTPDFVPGVSPSTGLPSVPGMSTGYRFFEHGDPLPGYFNEIGQPLDAQGRTCGPIPKPSYESEIGNLLRVKYVVIDGVRRDGWGNVLVSGDPAQVEALYPIYADANTLTAAAKAAGYTIAITVDGTQVWPGFSPADQYLTQPNGSVIRVN